jgi:putative ABC transport system permease protein
MKITSSLRALISALFRRSGFEQEMDEELRSHIQNRAEDLQRRGLPRAEAERQARIEFGGYQRYEEECRESVGVYFFETLLQDLRFGLRVLRKSPGFTLAAIVTLALGIGANTAIFSVVYGVLLAPLPYHDPGSIIVLNETTPKVGRVSVSYPNFSDWRARNHTFSEMAAVQSVYFSMTGRSQAEMVDGCAVSSNFLSMLGIRPAMGRDFNASEDRPGTAPVALLSYDLWQSHFGGESGVIGRALTLDDRSFTVVGVLPANFRLPEKTDFVIPIGVWATGNPEINERGRRGDMLVFARLAPGISLAQARTEMEGIAARIAQEYPATNDQFGVALQPIRDVFVNDMRPAILVLFAAVMFVLLIACANVANLFLVRGAARNKEIALRVALGAARGRIIRQILTESFLLALIGGTLGITLAIAGIRAIAQFIPTDMLAGATISLNGPVLFFAAGIVLLSALMFGLMPALQSARSDPHSELKQGNRSGSTGADQGRLRDILAIAEISFALVLLVGAGLMVKSLYRLLSVDPGFATERVLTMALDLQTAQYSKDPEVLNFWQQLLDHVRALPDVESAAVATAVPLTDTHSRTDITIENMALPKPGSFPHPDIHVVSPGYLSTLRIPLLRGRDFAVTDNQKSLRAGIISATVEQQYFAHEDPIGKRFMFGHPGQANQWITIVGVAASTKLYGLDNPARLEVYVPVNQFPVKKMQLVTRSKTDPTVLTSEIRTAITAINKDQPVYDVVTMSQLLSDSVSTRRMTLLLLGLFSALALLLAAIGIYGVISYGVTLRTHEIGVRLALGAQRSQVLRLVGGQGIRLALLGIGAGTVASLALTRLMRTLLFNVSATDPLTFAGVGTMLALVALLACYLPARRAMRVDPMIALRCE